MTAPVPRRARVICVTVSLASPKRTRQHIIALHFFSFLYDLSVLPHSFRWAWNTQLSVLVLYTPRMLLLDSRHAWGSARSGCLA